jgi:hypothetical protein
MLGVICAQCHIKALYAKCHYAECLSADCRGVTLQPLYWMGTLQTSILWLGPSLDNAIICIIVGLFLLL